MRPFLASACVCFLIGAILTIPIEAMGIAISTATLTYLAVTWRIRPILAAARKASYAFCFSDGGLVELRALSEAVLTWKPLFQRK